MKNMMRVKEAAVLWGITERRITSLCKEGKIEGANEYHRRINAHVKSFSNL